MDEKAFIALQDSLLGSLSDQTFLDYTYIDVGMSLRRCLHQTAQSKGSSAVLFYGPCYDVEKVVDCVLSTTKESFGFSLKGVARIDSTCFDSDDDAIIEIADQFLLTRAQSRAHQAALEDIEDFLGQCSIERSPAVIYVENFHVFIARKRQTFVYTLLDFLHNKGLFFTLILQTGSVDIMHRLEKRVISRLNATTLHLPALSPAALCLELSLRLLRGSEVGQEFRECVQRCFGRVRGDLLLGIESKKWWDIKPGDEKDEECRGGKGLIEKGELYDLLSRYIDAGYSRREFRNILKICISQLSPSQPYLTAQMFEEVLEQQQSPSLADLLCSLCPLDLWVYTAIAHLSMLRDSQGKLSHTPSVEEAAKVMDKLTGMFSKKGLTLHRLSLSLQSLSSLGLLQVYSPPPRSAPLSSLSIPHSVSPLHFLSLQHSPYEVRESYLSPPTRQTGYCWRRLLPSPSVVIAEKMRRAVLFPLEPLVYSES